MTESINNIFAIGTTFIFVGLIFLLICKIFFNKTLFYKKTINTLSGESVFIGMIIGICAMLGSLYYSDIANFDACKLCWYQRIAIYPAAIFFTYGYIKKDESFKKLTKILLYPALIISVLHNYLYFFDNSNSTFCDINVSCTTKYFEVFGFSTIPLMSLFVIAILIVLSSIKPIKE